MKNKQLDEVIHQIAQRKSNAEKELLTPKELEAINNKEIHQLASHFPAVFSVELQWYYYQHRKRTKDQLVKEIEE